LGNLALEMVTEIVQGLIALLLVGMLGGIALVEVMNGRQFSEPTTLSALAGAAVGFYFGQRNQRRQQEAINALTDKIVNGGTK
jgi:hypothetical protein